MKLANCQICRARHATTCKEAGDITVHKRSSFLIMCKQQS